jgi:CRISPR-associated protein (TIGR03984 family)
MSEQTSWRREIISIHSDVEAGTLDSLPTDLRAWLAEQAHADNSKLGLRWLLAHAEDGVIWGELRGDGQLYLSSDVFPVRGLSLHRDTLQQARLFGEHGELLIWRGPGDTWQTILHRDDQGDPVECIDEPHLLWGYIRGGETLQRRDGFVQITEGSQGIVHAPPIGAATPTETERVRLLVRHYVSEDEAGVARISGSRLKLLLIPNDQEQSD